MSAKTKKTPAKKPNPTKAAHQEKLPEGRTWVFTDGACSGNPGPGGWGSIILRPDGWVKELGGGEKSTTNNRMEILAVISAVETLNENEKIQVFTDSQYVIRGITEWLQNWMAKGWVNSQGESIANQDLWSELATVIEGRNIIWTYIRGHSGVPGNERADEIAVAFSKGQSPDLYESSLDGYTVSIQSLEGNGKASKKNKSKAPGVYLSLVNGVLQRHSSWKECEQRVRGQSGARFRKALSKTEEDQILRDWGLPSS
ncbi:MAG: ribonuclease HI [Bdellovibrio sp.]|nr:ribonuclease HI [Bdellovibrio sp.]